MSPGCSPNLSRQNPIAVGGVGNGSDVTKSSSRRAVSLTRHNFQRSTLTRLNGDLACHMEKLQLSSRLPISTTLRCSRITACRRQVNITASDADDDITGETKRYTLARPEPPLVALVQGLKAAVGGGFKSLKDPSGSYRSMTIAIVVATLALDAGGVTVVRQIGSGLVTEDTGFLMKAAVVAAEASLDVGVVFIAPVLAIAAVQQVLPLLGESLFFGALKGINKERAEQLEASEGLSIRGIGVGISRTLLFLRWQAALFLLTLPLAAIPVAGQAAASLAQLTLSSYMLGWEMLDVWCDKSSFDLENQKRIMDDHKWAVIGFAAPYTLLLAVPVVGAFTVGFAQSAAANLVSDVLEEELNE